MSKWKCSNYFLRHHRDAKQIVIGIDDAWCRPGTDIQKSRLDRFRRGCMMKINGMIYFNLFNDKSLENSVRMIEYWTGKREAKYDRTGYRDFTKDFGSYD